MALLPLSSWCCCPCHDSIFAIVDEQASLPLSWRHCRPCCAGAIANIAWALLPLLRRRHCPYHPDLFALTLHWRRHRHCNGIVSPVKLTCLRGCAGVVALDTLLLSPLVHCISTLVAQAPLPLLCLYCAVDLQASLPLLNWHVLSCGRRGRPRLRLQQHQRNKGKNISTTRVAMPAQWGQWCQHKEHDNTSAIDDATVTRANTRATRATMWMRW